MSAEKCEYPFEARPLPPGTRERLVEALSHQRMAQLVLGNECNPMRLCLLPPLCPGGAASEGPCSLCVRVDVERGEAGVDEAIRRWKLGC